MKEIKTIIHSWYRKTVGEKTIQQDGTEILPIEEANALLFINNNKLELKGDPEAINYIINLLYDNTTVTSI